MFRRLLINHGAKTGAELRLALRVSPIHSACPELSCTRLRCIEAWGKLELDPKVLLAVFDNHRATSAQCICSTSSRTESTGPTISTTNDPDVYCPNLQHPETDEYSNTTPGHYTQKARNIDNGKYFDIGPNDNTHVSPEAISQNGKPMALPLPYLTEITYPTINLPCASAVEEKLQKQPLQISIWRVFGAAHLYPYSIIFLAFCTFYFTLY